MIIFLNYLNIIYKLNNVKIGKKNNSNYNNKEGEENYIDKDIRKEELKSSKDNSSLSLLRDKIQ